MSALRVVAVVLAALALGGCAPYATDTDADATLVAATSRPDVVPLALISAELGIVGDGCFGLVGPDGTGTAVVFPIGTTADGDSVDIPGLGIVSVGERLEGGGGFSSPPESSVDFPEECRTDAVAYLNPYD